MTQSCNSDKRQRDFSLRYYSYRCGSTGFTLAARIACKLTVNNAITKAVIPSNKSSQIVNYI